MTSKFRGNTVALSMFGAGLILVLHHVVGFLANRGDYTPLSVGYVSPYVLDETMFYAPGVMHYSRTGFLGKEFDVYECRNQAIPVAIFPQIVIGSLVKILGSLEITWMLLHGILPALIWYLTFIIFRKFSSKEQISASLAWGFLFIPFGIRNSLMIGSMSRIQPVEIIRMPNPALSWLLLLAAVVAFAQVLNRPSGRNSAIAAGLASLQFLSYYFYFVAFAGAIAVIAVVVSMVPRRQLLGRLLPMLSGIVLGGAFWVYRSLGSRGSGFFDELYRVGKFGHSPSIVGLALTILGGSLVFWVGLGKGHLISDALSPEQEGMISILCGLVAGSGLGLNIQILTGFDAMHAHFWNRVLLPVAYLILGCLLALFIERREKRSRSIENLVISCASVIVTLGIARQVCVGLRTAAAHKKSDSRIELLMWARHHLSPESVIATSDPGLIVLIPSVSGCYTFVPASNRGVVPTEEALDRYIIVAKIEGKSFPDTQRRLGEEEPEKPYWQRIAPVLFMRDRTPSKSLKGLAKKWDACNLTIALQTRRLDYLILRRPGMSARALEGKDIHSTFSNSEFALLRVKEKATTLSNKSDESAPTSDSSWPREEFSR